MKLIIVGASGYVGRYIFSIARAKGYETVGTRFRSSNPDLVQFDMLTQNIMDIIPAHFISGNEPVYAVVCSSDCNINSCYVNREASYYINVVKTIELLEKLIHAGIKPVFLSTEFVYNGALGYYDESIPPCPNTEYGSQKVAVENYIQSHLPDCLIYRLSKIVSDEPSDHQFFADIYHKLRNNVPIECIQGQLFSPTDVRDVAQAIFSGLEFKLQGLYHVTNPEFFPREELARQFLISLHREVDIIVKPVEEFGFPESRPMKTYLNGARFVKKTGMHFTSMKDVIERFKAKVR